MARALRCIQLFMLWAVTGLSGMGSAAADSIIGNHPLQVDVLVLNYDPQVASYGDRRVHEVLNWNDPKRLAEAFARNVEAVSDGFVHYNIVQWRDLDEIPQKIDGFRYGIEQYVLNWQSGGAWHSPDTANYVQLLGEQGVPDLIDQDVIDEVWLFGGPYFGYWESSMAGPGAFYINGPPYPQVPSSRPFAVMGFNYERGDAEMLHSLGHRIESSVSRVFGGWNIQQPQTDWDRFTANVTQTQSGPYGVGSIHYPANGRSDYDYDSRGQVESTAADWENYPDLTGDTTLVSASAWGATHLGYMKYWMEHLPSARGLHAQTGRVNNWWKYVYDWTDYQIDGTPRVIPGDFDGDRQLTTQDIDLLSAQIRSGDYLAAYDLNHDQQLDQADRYEWVVEIRNSYFGDANLDGQFDTADFVKVFQAGQYEDQQPGNSTWSTGDWNGDGDFGTSDFVLAFVQGGFEQGPRLAVRGVPEPATARLLGAGLLMILPCLSGGRRSTEYREPVNGSSAVHFLCPLPRWGS